MDSTKRIIVNTVVQYLKAIFTTILSLYSTRLILDALNISDFGIYSVIGGVIAMLGFITNALVITTQRYTSFYYGKNNFEMVKAFFSNSLFLHLVISIFLCAILFSLQHWIINDVLTIPDNRITTANYVYMITVFMLFLTILTAPFKALFIASENIIYIAVVEMADAIIKLFLAIGLSFIQVDKLLFYAIMMGVIVFFNLMAFVVYALTHFKECSIFIKRKDLNTNYLKQLAGFAGWTTYGMGIIAGRNQGTAIILNHFFGTTINAAYGLAFQMNGAVAFVVTSLMNAISPQIIKAEGNKDREKMLKLSCMESKYSVILLSIVTIPIIVDMQEVLSLWLKVVPPYTCLFCQFILISFICDQLTLGLQTANQAKGDIRDYTLLIYTPKILYLPFIYLLYYYGYSIKTSMWLFLFIELGVAFLRLAYTHYNINLNIGAYIKSVIVPQIPLCLSLISICWLTIAWIDIPYKFILAYILSIMGGIITAWFITLDKNERLYINQLIKKHLACYI